MVYYPVKRPYDKIIANIYTLWYINHYYGHTNVMCTSVTHEQSMVYDRFT